MTPSPVSCYKNLSSSQPSAVKSLWVSQVSIVSRVLSPKLLPSLLVLWELCCCVMPTLVWGKAPLL